MLYKELGKSTGVAGYIFELEMAKEAILIMSFAAFFLTICYVAALKYITKPLLYGSLLLILVFGLCSSWWAYNNVAKYEGTDQLVFAQVFALVVCVMTVLYVICLCCQWRNIKLGATIMQVTSDYLTDNKIVAVLPFLSYFICVPILMIWMWSSTYIFSIGTPIFKAN